jgi:predicted nucleic acid-binding protein
LAAGEEHHLRLDCWNDPPVLELTSQEEEFANQLHPRLGSGKRACLAVAHLRSGMLVTDDLDARRVARNVIWQLQGLIRR